MSSSRAAELIFSHWVKKYSHIPDVVIVKGPLAGGHLGFRSAKLSQTANTLENLITNVISAIQPFEQQFQRSIPVIAAGGIYTGENIYKFLQLGAAGVQMATRFVTTDECDPDIRFKEMCLNCRESDLWIIESHRDARLTILFWNLYRRVRKSPFSVSGNVCTPAISKKSPTVLPRR